jgi:hypothetical protein
LAAAFRRRRRFGFIANFAALPLAALRPPAFFLALLMIKTSWLFQFAFRDDDACCRRLSLLSRCSDSRRIILDRNFVRFAKRKSARMPRAITRA